MKAVVLPLIALFIGISAASYHPLHSRNPQLGVVPRSQRSLLALRGGGREASIVEPPPPKSSSRHQLKLFTICAAIVLVWIGGATIFYSYNENWPLAQSLFYAVDTGLSIGFGAVAEEKLDSKLFTIFHVLLGASACGGAIALFAESAVDGSSQIAATEYSQSTLRAAFQRADEDNSGVLSAAEFDGVFVQAGLALSKEELSQARKVFDPDDDGEVTIDEFMAALSPFVTSSVPMTTSIRNAISRLSAPPVVRMLLGLRDLISTYRTLLLWGLWVGAGAVWGALTEGWDPITAIYFAVGGLGTGGLQAPSLTKDGVIPHANAVFVGLWCLTGIPVFGMALGGYASIFVNRIIASKERRAMQRPITMEEFEFAQSLFQDDGRLDLSEFIALELLRLGKVEMETLNSIKSEFNRMDKNRDGRLTAKEVLAMKGAGADAASAETKGPKKELPSSGGLKTWRKA